MGGYQQALRFALSRQANAYGFTLVVWGTGALATWELGKPDPADVFAFVGGVLVSISLIVGLVFGIRQPFRVDEPPRRPFSAMHLPSVPAAIASGWGLTLLVDGVAGFFVSGLVAVALYQLLLALEVAFALVPRRTSDEARTRTR
ncbi:MAG: hypothetical protein ACRDM1_08325 [Gaiellaceae bacterium]